MFFNKKQKIVAITDGDIKDISSVSDPMFAQKIMGDGFAIETDEDTVEVCSPADGTLTVLFPTGHAFGVKMKNGVEILVHLGINTVEANGKGFTVHVSQGQKVHAGDRIVTVDAALLRQTYEMPLMTIVTETAGQNMTMPVNGKVQKGQTLIEL